jgi:hypothetical protein
MGFPGPSLDDHLAAQLRGLSQFAMSESEAAEGARNLVSFFRLLAEIDRNETERGDEDAGNRSGYRVREAKGLADRARHRRAR